MEESIKKIELIDQFITNEKKSKQWTVISVSVFCLLGLVVFALSYLLNDSNAKYKKQNVELIKTQESLANANDQLDLYISQLQQDSVSQSRNKNADSLLHENEALKAIFKNTLVQITNNNMASVEERLGSIYRNTFPDKSMEEGNKIIQSIINTNATEIHSEDKLIVFVQYMPEYRNAVPDILKQLNDNNIKVAKPELIKGLTFNPAVRYFNDEDKETADRIANILNSSQRYSIKIPFKSQLMDLKAPLHQVEVWIGDYRPKDFKVQQYSRIN